MSKEATRTVETVLDRSRASCLVRSVVRQRWLLAHGEERALVIGVTRPGEPFRAHAWLDGDPSEAHQGLVELVRRPPRATGAEPGPAPRYHAPNPAVRAEEVGND